MRPIPHLDLLWQSNHFQQVTLVVSDGGTCSRVLHGASSYGPAIRLEKVATVQSHLARFVEDLLFTVVHSDPEPMMTRPTIIDVTFKEFVNTGWMNEPQYSRTHA